MLVLRRKLVVALAIAIASLAFVSEALAWRAPTRTEKAKIVAAIRSGGVFTRANYKIRRVRISTIDGRFAGASAVPRDPTTMEGGLIKLKRKHGKWRVIDFGTAGFCSRIDRDILAQPSC